MNDYTNDFLVKLKRKNYLTPTHFLDYINSYLNLIHEKTDMTTHQVTYCTIDNTNLKFKIIININYELKYTQYHTS